MIWYNIAIIVNGVIFLYLGAKAGLKDKEGSKDIIYKYILYLSFVLFFIFILLREFEFITASVIMLQISCSFLSYSVGFFTKYLSPYDDEM